jgi:hypothetical protein
METTPPVPHSGRAATRSDVVRTGALCTLLIVASNLANLPATYRRAHASEDLLTAFQQFSKDSSEWRSKHHAVLEQLARDADRQFAEIHAELEVIRARVAR